MPSGRRRSARGRRSVADPTRPRRRRTRQSTGGWDCSSRTSTWVGTAALRLHHPSVAGLHRCHLQMCGRRGRRPLGRRAVTIRAPCLTNCRRSGTATTPVRSGAIRDRAVGDPRDAKQLIPVQCRCTCDGEWVSRVRAVRAGRHNSCSGQVACLARTATPLSPTRSSSIRVWHRRHTPPAGVFPVVGGGLALNLINHRRCSTARRGQEPGSLQLPNARSRR